MNSRRRSMNRRGWAETLEVRMLLSGETIAPDLQVDIALDDQVDVGTAPDGTVIALLAPPVLPPAPPLPEPTESDLGLPPAPAAEDPPTIVLPFPLIVLPPGVVPPISIEIEVPEALPNPLNVPQGPNIFPPPPLQVIDELIIADANLPEAADTAPLLIADPSLLV